MACSLLALAGPAHSQSVLSNEHAEQLLNHVEKRAINTRFSDLERFAEAAYRRRDVDGLRQMQHAIGIYINQGENDKARHWNARLAQVANALKNDRFTTISRLNSYIAAYEAGTPGQEILMAEVMNNTSDWYVRVMATRYYSVTRFDQNEIGEGLKLLGAVQAQIPANDTDTNIAQAGVWEMIGIGLLYLHDVQGATDALMRYELDYGDQGWPRPDYDSIYNLADMAIQIGDRENAERFFDVHNRLTQKSDIQGLQAYNSLLCARVSYLSEDMPRVLRCLDTDHSELEGDIYLQARAWPLKIGALARTGRVAEAERLFARWKSLETPVPGESISNLGLRAEAELLFAKGRHEEAVALWRRYSAMNAMNDARAYSDGIHQITQDMQQQLSMRRHQLETEQANVRLQGAMIRAQAWIVGVTLFLMLFSSVAFIWLWMQARALRKARSRAEQANTAKTQFLANMSHEIRTPLNGVIAMADALYRRNLAKDDRELLDIIRSSAGNLERLLSDILDSARIESGELKLEAAPFKLFDMIEGVFQLWSSQAEEKGVSLELESESDTDQTVMGDVVRLRQVLNNLVSNALKFTEKGSVRLKVERVGEAVYRFTVSDTGVGFDESVRQRLFARFQQADESITRRYGGSGLGLNISQNLIHLMGGDLDCSSVVGEGSRFWFEIELPTVLNPQETIGVERRNVLLEHSIETARGLGLRVLLADDHAANRKVVEVLLSSLDVELTSVEDGAQAVRAFEKDYFDLVFMDMQMPVMDGLTATRKLREIERRDGRIRTPIVMLTANAMSEHVEASLEAGADRHLAKPLTVEALMNCINAAMDTTND